MKSFPGYVGYLVDEQSDDSQHGYYTGYFKNIRRILKGRRVQHKQGNKGYNSFFHPKIADSPV